MRQQSYAVLLWTALILILCGCRGEAPSPKTTHPPAAEPVPDSRFSASLMLSAAQLASILNDRIDRTVIDAHGAQMKCVIGRCRANVIVERNGAISVEGQNGVLTVRLPFSASIDVFAQGLLSFLHARADAKGMALAQSHLRIAPNWHVKSDLNGKVVLDYGRLRIGPLVTNIAQFWNANAELLSRPLWQRLDKQIAGINLRSQIAELWTRSFTPIRVGKAPNLWLVLDPKTLEMAQPEIHDGVITVAMAITGKTHLVVQDQEPLNPPTPLSDAQPLRTATDQFSVVLPLLLSYEKAAQMLSTSLAGRGVPIGPLRLSFTRFSFLPSGEDIVLKTRLCAGSRWDVLGWFASCGTLYLRGVPVFDPVHESIHIARLRYDLASEGLLLHALHALDQGALLRILRAHLVFDESKALHRLRSEIAASVAKPVGRDMAISAQLQSLGQPRIGWTSAGIVVYLSGRGKLHATIRDP